MKRPVDQEDILAGMRVLQQRSRIKQEEMAKAVEVIRQARASKDVQFQGNQTRFVELVAAAANVRWESVVEATKHLDGQLLTFHPATGDITFV